MADATKRATVDFENNVHRALRLKAAETDRSVSELVNEAVRAQLAEDAEDSRHSAVVRRNPPCRSRTSSRTSSGVASYNVVIKRSAAKELEAIPRKDREKLVNKIALLAHDPRPPGSEKLAGDEKYRMRHGDYRVLYEIDDASVVVVVVRVAHRREVYR